MVKFQTMLVFLIALQICLLIFQDPSQGNNITMGNSGSLVWDFVTNITNWNGTGFILLFLGVASLALVSGIIAGTTFGFKTDFLLFAGQVAAFISFGGIMVQLANVINNLVYGILYDPAICNAGTACSNIHQITVFITASLIGAIAIMYILSVIDWWRRAE